MYVAKRDVSPLVGKEVLLVSRRSLSTVSTRESTVNHFLQTSL